MREYKFRAWNDFFKEMYYFDFNTNIEVRNGSLWIICKEGSVSVNSPSIKLMQYIERKDKHKKEIYEGDIVLYDRNIHEDIDKQKFEVIWMQDGYCLRELQHKYILDGIWWEMTEKIGNIYDNPELLKEGNV